MFTKRHKIKFMIAIFILIAGPFLFTKSFQLLAQLPIGTIVAYGGDLNKLPNDWKLCNGDVLSIKKYPELYNIIGTSWGNPEFRKFNLPDLEGLFLRGVDKNSRRDPDAKDRDASHSGGFSGPRVGTFQPDAVGKHPLSISIPIGYGFPQTHRQISIENGGRQYSKIVTDPSHGPGKETRPKNAAVHWIIKIR
ncbi:MAG: phage tail protein [Candidatus Hatepunaea meridiana]|nr:phage tail protein [Candidatus Hatepunaea meridiana]